MSIIFDSPKRKRRKLIWIIGGLLAFIMLVIALVVFPPQWQDNQSGDPIAIAELQLNLGILESDPLKNLERFSTIIQSSFTYTAKDKQGKTVAGNVLASDETQAKKILTDQGFENIELKGPMVGKTDPFLPYYQTTTK